MAIKAYLSIITEDDERDLFQSDASLPFFWYCFFDKTAFDAVVPEMEKLYAMSISSEEGGRDAYFSYVEENPGSADILLEKEAFRRNAQAARAYIKGKFPERAVLYDDYIRYIDEQVKGNELIAVSIFDYVNAYADAQDFISTVHETLSAVGSANKGFTPELLGDEVFAMTGKDRHLGYGFRDKSDDYLEACKLEEKTLAAKAAVEQQQGKKRGFRSNSLALLVVGALLTYWGFNIYKERGTLDVTTVVPIVIGVLAFLMGAKGTWDFFKKRMQAKTDAEAGSDAEDPEEK